MKKLMMAFVVALAAIGLNAATVNWSVELGWVTETDVDADTTLAGYCGYAFDGNAYTQLALQEALTTTGTTVLGSALGDGTAVVAGTVNDGGELMIAGSGLSYDDTASPTYASILLVLVDADVKDGSAFTIASLGSVEVTDAVTSGNAVFGGGGDLYTGLVSTWSTISSGSGPEPIPEPTSGLLLLVGGALLALRRRRLA